MTRNLCCLVLTCLVTACAPKKAVEVAEAPVTTPTRNHKNTQPAATGSDAPEPDMPRVVNADGMQIPDLTTKLPDRNDMTPTAPPAPTGGGVIATPPAPRKPVNE